MIGPMNLSSDGVWNRAGDQYAVWGEQGVDWSQHPEACRNSTSGAMYTPETPAEKAAKKAQWAKHMEEQAAKEAQWAEEANAKKAANRLEAQVRFQSIDTNGDGILDALELSAGLCDSGLTDDDIEALFLQLDSNSDNQVSEAEFINGYLEIFCKMIEGDHLILGNYTSSQGGELICISKPDGCRYYSILQGGIRKSNMMLAGEFKANGLLHFKPYAITGKLKAGKITWSNGTVYTREDID